jgi:hypothetical protein
MNSINIYNQFSAEYDQWFEKNEKLFKSELLALQQAIPMGRMGKSNLSQNLACINGRLTRKHLLFQSLLVYLQSSFP